MQWSWERLGKCNQEDPGSQMIRTPKDTGRSQRSCVQYGTGRRKQRNAVTAGSSDFHGCRLSFLRWKTERRPWGSSFQEEVQEEKVEKK